MAVMGQVIDDKYEILKLIGQGGMSKVYLARDRRLNKLWAIKEIEKNARDENNEIVFQSAIAEANMIKSLDHPAIVRITDIIDNGKVIYIVEDYIEGEPLSNILENNGAQPQELVVEWALQICEALEYLHTRKPPIIYRDMKPANVMVKPDGNIKVIDFGIAREYKERSLADTVSLGTKGYAAPEQFGGKGQTDVRTDVYCLGVTLHHLITGQNPCEPPYELYPIRHYNPQLSSGLEAIIQKCTQLNPNDRYQSCAELLYALHNYEKYEYEYKAKQKKRLNSFIGVCVMCFISLVVGVIGIFMKNSTNNADYDQNIAQAEKTSEISEKIQYYSNAIDIKPLENQAYLGLVKSFKDDASFTTEEETVLIQKINTHINELRGEDSYPEIAFEIGKLYWYYYDYGKTDGSDNQITRMKSAIQWFEDVDKESKNYQMAAIYGEIGRFNRDITLNIEEATDTDKYEPYWKNINELVSTISKDENENEIMKLEMYRLATYSIETYARKFKAAGIVETDMQNLYQKVVDGTNQVSTTSDKTEQIKNEVVARFTATQNAIKNAYREQVIG